MGEREFTTCFEIKFFNFWRFILPTLWRDLFEWVPTVVVIRVKEIFNRFSLVDEWSFQFSGMPKKQINIQTKACQHIISFFLQKWKRPSRTFKYRERKTHLGTAEPTLRFFINMDLGIKIGWWRRDWKRSSALARSSSVWRKTTKAMDPGHKKRRMILPPPFQHFKKHKGSISQS